MNLWLYPFTSIVGYYRNDTIPIICYENEVVVRPAEKHEFEISTYTMMDGATLFPFEPLFGYKEDYESDMIHLLSDIQFMYVPNLDHIENPSDSVLYYLNPTLTKPSRDIKVTVVNDKDNVLEYWWRRKIKKEELPFVTTYKQLEDWYNRISD